MTEFIETLRSYDLEASTWTDTYQLDVSEERFMEITDKYLKKTHEAAHAKGERVTNGKLIKAFYTAIADGVESGDISLRESFMLVHIALDTISRQFNPLEAVLRGGEA